MLKKFMYVIIYIINLFTQVFAVKQLCFSQNKSMMAMLNLQNRGITEDRILYINNLLKSKRWNMDTKPNSWIEK
jgi:hypothetical protein